MKERTVYVANDGKEFDFEEDCREYELAQKGGEMCFFGLDGKQIPVTQEAWDNANVYSVCIVGEKGIEQMKDILSNYGHCKEVEDILKRTIRPLVFYYDDDSDKWVDAKDELYKVKDKARRIDDLIRKLQLKTYMLTE